MSSNSQAIWSTLIGWILVGILQYGPLTWKRPVSELFLSPGKFNLRETQKVFKKRNLIFSLAEFSLHVKGYRSKFADGGRRLRTFTKRSVRSLKEKMPYNKRLARDCTGEYILTLGRFCTDRARDLGPIFPSTDLELG